MVLFLFAKFPLQRRFDPPLTDSFHFRLLKSYIFLQSRIIVGNIPHLLETRRNHYSDIVSDIPSGSIYGIFILTGGEQHIHYIYCFLDLCWFVSSCFQPGAKRQRSAASWCEALKDRSEHSDTSFIATQKG
jgi:hypothetical protein